MNGRLSQKTTNSTKDPLIPFPRPNLTLKIQ